MGLRPGNGHTKCKEDTVVFTRPSFLKKKIVSHWLAIIIGSSHGIKIESSLSLSLSRF
jgi:hypothetical protein